MKRKILWVTAICVLILVMMGVARFIEVQDRQTDPNWKIAEEIYKVEKALKEADDDYECQSVSKVTPFTYTDSEGNSIVYYYIQTAYLSNESGEYTGLNIDAIGLAIDLDMIENRRECTVNEYDAFLCDVGDRTFLCWTLSTKISCVIEYSSDYSNDSDILRMAESVSMLDG